MITYQTNPNKSDTKFYNHKLELNSQLERLSLSDVDKFCGKEVFLESSEIPTKVEEPKTHTDTFPGPHSIEAMDIDGVSSSHTERLTPPREFCDSPYHHHSESSMNFDYLDKIMESRGGGHESYGHVDDRLAIDRCLFSLYQTSKVFSNRKLFYSLFLVVIFSFVNFLNFFSFHIKAYWLEWEVREYFAIDLSPSHWLPSFPLYRFLTALDQLDARVEKFRKDALGLQEKRDFLLLSIDLIKSNDLLQDMKECEYGFHWFQV